MKAFMVIASCTTGVVLFLIGDFFFGSLIVPPYLILERSPYLSKSLGWYELKPNYFGFDRYGPLVFPVATDDYGFRKDLDSKTGSKYDVIFLGDSFTYGINGAWEQTFVGMYAKISDKQVINAGVSSYSPTAYVYQYKKALSAFLLNTRHIVVIGIDVGDVHDEAGFWIDGDNHPIKRAEVLAYSKSQSVENRTSEKEEELANRKSETSKTKSMLREVLKASFPMTLSIYRYYKYKPPDEKNLNKSFEDLVNDRRSAFTHADWETLNQQPTYGGYAGFAPLGVRGGLERIEQKLREIIELGRKHEARIYFLIYPWEAQIHYEDKFDWSAYIKDMCRRLSCDGVIDTIPRFRTLAKTDKDWYRKYYIYGDFHFTEAGNAVIADEILKELRTN